MSAITPTSPPKVAAQHRQDVLDVRWADAVGIVREEMEATPSYYLEIGDENGQLIAESVVDGIRKLIEGR